MNDKEYIKSVIRTVPNWPKPGIMFRDITTLLKDARWFSAMMQLLFQRYEDTKIDYIVGIESRGFIMGAALAQMLGIGFVPIRKKGKLPAEVIAEEYDLEYGKDKIEIHKDALKPWDNVLLVDDLLATGGTMLAACRLIEKLWWKIIECCFVVDLPDLWGKKKLEAAEYKAFTLVEFEGE